MESLALLGSTLFYFFACCSTWFTVRSRGFRPGRFDTLAIYLGVFCQTIFLVLRGQTEHSCPIATLPEILIFLSWAMGLFYIFIGSTYRISLMGAFSAPFILILQTVALLLPHTMTPTKISPPWIEAHAALSLLSFGAFGLGCVASLMFLVQEKELKSQHPSPLFHYLPPIRLLEKVTVRLLWVGFVLLTMSFAAGFLAAPHFNRPLFKFWISLLLWSGYFITLLAHQLHRLNAHRFAFLAMVIFLTALLILPAMRLFSNFSF